MAADKQVTVMTGVTDDVAGFVTSAKSADIPKDVAHLGKRSVLDGIGLALAGARSECGHIAQQYLANLGLLDKNAAKSNPKADLNLLM